MDDNSEEYQNLLAILHGNVNPLANYVVEPDDEDNDFGETKEWLLAPTVIFGVWDSPADPVEPDATSCGIAVSFALPQHFARDGAIYDQHVWDILERKGYEIPDYLGEDMENTFLVWEDGMDFDTVVYPPTITKAQVVADLQRAGFKFDQALDDFLNQ